LLYFFFFFRLFFFFFFFTFFFFTSFFFIQTNVKNFRVSFNLNRKIHTALHHLSRMQSSSPFAFYISIGSPISSSMLFLLRLWKLSLLSSLPLRLCTITWLIP
jgi:hypothetical protein